MGRLLACAAVLVLLVSGCGGSAKEGFLDTQNLQQIVRKQTNDALTDPAGQADRESSGIWEGVVVTGPFRFSSTMVTAGVTREPCMP